MDNKSIYKKTIGFSIRRLLWDILSLMVLLGLAAIGFLITDKTNNNGLIGLVIGLLIGGVIAFILVRYASYSYKAAQIAMMTKGITEGELPDDIIGEGKRIVKERFITVAAYFAGTRIIKGIFNQIGKAITSVGESIGGDAGGTIGSIISSIIQVIVAYLCDCCLGWVFFRHKVNAGRATCEGAVLFFKHGKTLAKNLGRIFGMGIVSFIIIASIFGGITFGILQLFPDAMQALSEEIVSVMVEDGTAIEDIPEVFTNTMALSGILAVIVGSMFWSFIHSTFIRPFVLVGVLRNFINSGIEDMPKEEDFAKLDSKSKKFQKLHTRLDN